MISHEEMEERFKIYQKFDGSKEVRAGDSIFRTEPKLTKALN